MRRQALLQLQGRSYLPSADPAAYERNLAAASAAVRAALRCSDVCQLPACRRHAAPLTAGMQCWLCRAARADLHGAQTVMRPFASILTASATACADVPARAGAAPEGGESLQRRILDVLVQVAERGERSAMLADALTPPAATGAEAAEPSAAGDADVAQPTSASDTSALDAQRAAPPPPAAAAQSAAQSPAQSPADGRPSEHDSAAPEHCARPRPDMQVLGSTTDEQQLEAGTAAGSAPSEGQLQAGAEADADADAGEEQLWTTPLQLLQVRLFSHVLQLLLNVAHVRCSCACIAVAHRRLGCHV